MKLSRAGVDIAKSVFHVHAVDNRDNPEWQAKLRRDKWLDALCARLSPGAEVGMECLDMTSQQVERMAHYSGV